MDDRLFKRLEKIEEQIELLKEAEGTFLHLEANRKAVWAKMFLATSGTVMERESKVYSSQDWIDFMMGHASAEIALNHEKRRYELRLKAYDAEHLTYKNELPAVRRQA